ncbi:MAG: hypothetical protein FOGNACKC_00857 [Anaerolineae bacterium]|nr:hypothetical protein [Anaerolineae bacterium]
MANPNHRAPGKLRVKTFVGEKGIAAAVAKLMRLRLFFVVEPLTADITKIYVGRAVFTMLEQEGWYDPY